MPWQGSGACVALTFTFETPLSPPIVSSILSTLTTTPGYSTHTSLVSGRLMVVELPGVRGALVHVTLATFCSSFWGMVVKDSESTEAMVQNVNKMS